MTKFERWFAVAVFVIGFGVVFNLRAQLQQSGGPGSTVTANAGNNLNTSLLALDSTLTGGTQKTKLVDTGGANVGSISAAGALKVDGSAVTQPVSGTFWQATQPISGTVTVNALPAGTNLIGKTVQGTGCGATPFDSGFIANIATGGTDLATSATCANALFVSNTTASAVTVTLKDKAGTPNTYISGFSIPANSNLILPLWGMKFTGGMNLTAGTSSALQAQVVGLQ